jgi:hypothetical protein
MRLPSGNYSFTARPVDSTHVSPFWLGLTSITAARTLDWNFTGAEWIGKARSAETLQPLPDAYLSVGPRGSGDYAYANADANGAFRLIVQPGIVYSVTAYAPNMYSHVSSIAAGSDSTLDLLFSPVAIYGAGLDPRGENRAR